jgi:hypothetical protein
MYAYTNNSYRGISSQAEVLPGETFSSVVPEAVITEIKKSVVRSYRSEMLRATDWTQLADNSLTAFERAAFATYRQALRNLPQSPEFPEVEWPTPPAVGNDAGDGLPEQA